MAKTLRDLKAGDRFRFAASARDTGEDAALYVMLENNGDRCFVRCLETDLPFPPTELARTQWEVEMEDYQ